MNPGNINHPGCKPPLKKIAEKNPKQVLHGSEKFLKKEVKNLFFFYKKVIKNASLSPLSFFFNF